MALERCKARSPVADTRDSPGDSMSGCSGNSSHRPSTCVSSSIGIGTPNTGVALQQKNNDSEKDCGMQYDIIIGSDLVYCKSDPFGILEVLSVHLSNSGVFVIVVPEPSHRYGTEYLVPTLQNGGFEVYYRSIAHTNCSSCEVSTTTEGNSVTKRAWTSAGPRSDNTHDDLQDVHRLKLLSFVDSLTIDDDFLVADLEEEEFVAWQLVIGHKKINSYL